MSLQQSGDMTAAFSSALESASSTPVAEASPASTPETTTPPAEPSAPAATTQAAAETPDPASASPEADTAQTKGRIRLPDGTFAPPEHRWPDILDNQRKKAAEEAEARVRQEIEQQYAWAKAIDDSERQGLLTWRAAMHGDPQAIAAIKAHPQAVQWLKGLIGESAPSQADAEPEPDLQLPDGTPVYSAPQLAKREAWRERQLEAKLQKQLEPFQQVTQTLQEREAQARAYTEVGSVLTEFRNDPDFKAHEADIKAELARDAALQRLADVDPRLALETAYSRVWKAKVLPSKERDAEAKVLANLQQRAVAGTVNPNAAVTTTPKKFTQNEQGFAEALAHYGVR